MTNRLALSLTGIAVAACGLLLTHVARGSSAVTDPAIAFVESGRTSKLRVMNADGTGATTLLSSPGGFSDPAWAPDGSAIAVRSGPEVRRVDIAVVNGVPTAISTTFLVSQGWWPAWSPLGDRIVYIDPWDGASAALMAVPASGGAPLVLYSTSANLYSPTFSSDASHVAFTEGTDATGYTVRVLDLATASVAAVWTAPAGVLPIHLDWARTQQMIAFSATVGNAKRLFVLDLASGVATDIGAGWAPSWSPDDTKLVSTNSSGNLQFTTLATGTVKKLSLKGDFPDRRRF